MVDILNEKLENAVKKLTTLNEITLKSTRSSHYSFGLEKSTIKNRLNVVIKLDVDLSVNCQIIFDSKHMHFPPDIIIHKHIDIDNIGLLLPNEDWDLEQEDCLYIWVKRIIKLLGKKPVIKEVQPKLKRSFFDKLDDELPDLNVFKNPKKRVFIDDTNDVGPKTKKTTLLDDENHDTDVDMMYWDKEDLPLASSQNVTEDEYSDFDLKQTNKPSLDYKTKFKDDFISCDDDYDFEKLEQKKYNPNDSSSVESCYFIPKEESRIASEKHASSTPIKDTHKRFGSIKGNIAPFIKNADIFTFPPKSDKQNRRSTYENDEDDIIIVPNMTKEKNSPELQIKVSSKKQAEPYQTTLNLPTKKPTGKFKTTSVHPHLTKLADSPQTVSSSPQKSIQPYQTKITNALSNNEDQTVYRKKFMVGWLSKYKDHIMTYDMKNFEYFSLFLTIKLPTTSNLWAEYAEFKSIGIMELEDIEDITTSLITRPKPKAPIIVHFKMDPRSFPSSQLKIQLISVMNTPSIGSSEPESLKFNYQVDQQKNLSDLISDIMDVVKEKVPKFHYQLENL